MKSKGYFWNESRKNYIIEPQEIIEEVETKGLNQDKLIDLANSCNCMEKYGGLFKMLEDNKDKLVGLLQNDGGVKVLPRYVIAGVTITKTIGMNNEVDQIIKGFCGERNITQKEFFEIAAIELLKRNCYSDEVKANVKV